MERLTKKYNIITRTTALVGEIEYVVKEDKFGNAVNKLGKLEDILEKYNMENINMLDDIINSIRTNTLIDIENKEILELENANLKSELAELKQKAIVPKFKIGQEVWAISVYRKDCVDNFIIQEICFCSRYGLYYKTNMGINLYEYYFDVFATKEEAEQKLAEIKGEKDG